MGTQECQADIGDMWSFPGGLTFKSSPTTSTVSLSKVGHQHTELEHTPKRNLYQQAILAGIPFIVGERGIAWFARGIADWVCENGGVL